MSDQTNIASAEKAALCEIIRLAPTFKEADELITDVCGISKIKDKIDFLHNNFAPLHIQTQYNPNISKTSRDKSIYFCLLTTIIEEKWS